MSCSDTAAEGKRVTRQDYGERWPLTIDEGILQCVRNGVFLKVGSQVYAINGTAKGISRQLGYPPIEEIVAVDMAAKKDLLRAGVDEADANILSDTSPLIDDGLLLCR
jgi:hypothetical protein